MKVPRRTRAVDNGLPMLIRLAQSASENALALDFPADVCARLGRQLDPDDVTAAAEHMLRLAAWFRSRAL